MLYRSAEYHRALVPDVLQPSIHNKAVALRHIDLAFQIPDVVLHAIKPHLGQVNVGVDTNAANRYQFTNLYCCLDVQLMGGVFEDVQDHLAVVCTLRRRGQPQGEGRLKVGQNLLVCIGRGVMGFIHDQIVKGIIPELIQM